MRKHDVRKWIHAILDLLPLIILPAFMIYSHRHDINSYQVTREEDIVVDFNQQVRNGNFENTNYWVTNGVNFSVNDNVATISSVGGQSIYQTDVVTNIGHQYLVTYYAYADVDTLSGYGLGGVYRTGAFNVTTSNHKYSDIFVPTTSISDFYVYLYDENRTLYVSNVMLFDLTFMFGEGNEPSIALFDTYFNDEYYDFVYSRDVLVPNVEVTYNDTDIGSQMLYSLYNVTDKYFNFNKVFNFDKIYDWFQLNIFHGTAPLSMSIAWNVFLYEFLMDLMFLLYGLFMFFVDFCTNLIDRFHTKCSGGK